MTEPLQSDVEMAKIIAWLKANNLTAHVNLKANKIVLRRKTEDGKIGRIVREL